MSEDPTSDTPADEVLVERFRRDPDGASGHAALSVLLERWSPRTYRWAHRFTRERESALDLAQDCMLQLIRALPEYESRGRFSAWLFTVVHNRCLDHARKRARVKEPDIDVDELIGPEPGPDDSLARQQTRERVFAAMREHLDPDERTALWLRAAEEMSVDDITDVLKVTGASGARGLLQTARRKLRAALASPTSPEDV